MKYLLFIILTMLTFSGCSVSGLDTDPSLLSKEDYTAFSQEVEKKLHEGDADFFNQHFNMEFFLARMEKDSEFHVSSKAEIRIEIQKEFNLAERIISVIKTGGSFHFLHLKETKGGPVAVFRLLTVEGNLTYNELELSARQDKEPVINDFYAWTTGEKFSKTMARLMTMASLKESNRTKFSPKENSETDKLYDFFFAVKDGKPDEIVKSYAMLSPAMQKQKYCQIYLISAFGKLNDEKYREAIEEYNKQFPNDPFMSILNIDRYYLEGEMRLAANAVSKVDKMVGGDPYLDFVRANFIFLEGRQNEAMGIYTDVLKKEPSLIDNSKLLFKIYINKKEYEKAAGILEHISVHNPETVKMVLNDTSCNEFIHTKPYIKWYHAYSDRQAAKSQAD